MVNLNAKAFSRKTASYLTNKVPFVFMVDFDQTRAYAMSFTEAAENGVFFNVKGITNAPAHESKTGLPVLEARPVCRSVYNRAFETVRRHILQGDSFLLNLTFASRVFTRSSLSDIFHQARAPYKLLFQDKFVVFSPESFIKIAGNTIASFPMKGTINACLPDAEKQLMNSRKEFQEHGTIVDLIRNDLSMVASGVHVPNFRYLSTIETERGKILQTSSEIKGNLPEDWPLRFGELLFTLLPAGSISGAPKPKTLHIIRAAETSPRGFYTGVFGIYDGQSIDSAVNIRFLEKQNDAFYYRSGGGITYLSKMEEEYEELMNKIYVPTA